MFLRPALLGDFGAGSFESLTVQQDSCSIWTADLVAVEPAL